MKTENLVLYPSSSGKFDSKSTKLWFENCFVPLTGGKKSLLMLDSFGCHKKQKSSSALEHVFIEIIPPNTTSLIQPCDVYFFRQFKILYRKLVDCARVLKLTGQTIESPHLRSFHIKCVSHAHSQFMAAIFRPMIKGAFNLSGFGLPEGELIEKFDRANAILFRFTSHICEEEHDETNEVSIGTFIRCAHCRKNLCFNCFLKENSHLHLPIDLEHSLLDYYGLGLVKTKG